MFFYVVRYKREVSPVTDPAGHATPTYSWSKAEVDPVGSPAVPRMLTAGRGRWLLGLSVKEGGYKERLEAA